MSRTIIAGSRNIHDYNFLNRVIQRSGFQITEVVSGTASGVDRLGERWAIENKVPIARFPADWNLYGKSAGYKRNLQMAEHVGPDGQAIILWDGVSRGTKHMIDICKEKKIKFHLEIFQG